MKLHPYPVYQDSGLGPIGDVPKHWDVRRMRNVAEMRVSNVDKHSSGDEWPVRLCNYMDVYKNDYITEHVAFMSATARSDEVQRFRLNANDVLITKDSEDWKDIGVPALVRYMAPDLICGYHLALLRPRDDVLLGEYLLRALQSQGVAYQFHVSATGVTRYGLSHDAIKSVCLPIPPLPEQQAIVRFLEHIDRRVNRYIRAKRRLIALLNEQKQAIIQRAVTRGLDPDVRLKPSGVDWLGDIPEHWEVRTIGRMGRIFKGNGGTKEDDVESGVPCVRYGDLYTTHEFFIRHAKGHISQDRASAYTQIRYGDVLFAASGETIEDIGRSAVNLMRTDARCGGDILVWRPTVNAVPEFLGYVCDSAGSRQQKARMGRGFTVIHMYGGQLKDLLLPMPPVAEQEAIVFGLDRLTASIDAALDRTNRELGLIREYQQRLLADVVTGKLDVREAAATLPDEGYEEDSVEVDGEDDEGIPDVDDDPEPEV